MNKTALIFKHEFTQEIIKPGFIVMTLLVPVLALLLVSQGCSDDSTGGVLTDPCLDFTPDGTAVAGTVTTKSASRASGATQGCITVIW